MLVETSLTVEELELAERLFKAARSFPETFEEAFTNDDIKYQILNSLEFSRMTSLKPSNEAVNEVNKVNNWSLSTTDDVNATISRAMNLSYTLEYIMDNKINSQDTVYKILFEIGSYFPSAEIYAIQAVRAIDPYTFQSKINFKARFKTNKKESV